MKHAALPAVGGAPPGPVGMPIAQAALQVVYEGRVVEQDELTRHVARLFGWQRTGDGIRARIGDAIDKLVVNAQIERDGSGLRYAGKKS